MKKGTNACMGNSGKSPFKHLWGKTSWVGSGFDHSESPTVAGLLIGLLIMAGMFGRP